MGSLGSFIVPLIIASIVLAGLFKKQNVFDVFLQGAKEGIPITVSIVPPLIGLMTAIAMLNASGAFTMLAQALSPLWSLLHMPGDVVPLAIMRSISGSGSLSLYQNILQKNGPDSFIGRVASVLQGSSETTFYTIAVYFGSVGISKTRHTLPAALAADFTGLVMSVLTVSLFLK
ncbi:MAG: nucleoside recognition domain-containing protein [Ethanoligenens sp.]|uniref:spore maturation protein n=1 Tax=Ethanoligenens sp. TaxID=2099655 RepID=UPI0039EA0FE6